MSNHFDLSFDNAYQLSSSYISLFWNLKMRKKKLYCERFEPSPIQDHLYRELLRSNVCSLFVRLMLRKLTALCFRAFAGCTLRYTLW